MIETVYIEESVREHPRAVAVLSRFKDVRQIVIERYGEVFNPKSQNFRLQKQKPALILAKKYRNFVHVAPENYGVGGHRNYYFSHMLNCLYDCRYCFLQGMYRSAHYVLFVNYEDFQEEIRTICKKSPREEIYFFSGYDCDSLALEPVTRFAEDFLPFFAGLPNAWLELRTKSTQIRNLTAINSLPRVINAFSLSPQELVDKVEARTPSLKRRLAAIKALQEHGWLIGLRFDPLVYQAGYQQQYQRLFEQVFEIIDTSLLHSVSLGVFRLPDAYFKAMHKLYPEERLFAGLLHQKNGMTSYKAGVEREVLRFCMEQLSFHVPAGKLFPCAA